MIQVFRPDDISDMQMSITFAHKRYLKSPLFAVGFSAGSNQLVKYLGMHGNDQPVKAAISVCNGFEYEKHLKRIENTTLGHDVYSRGMTYLHQEYLRTHKDELEKIDGFDLQKVGGKGTKQLKD
jgi:predicted alpha/beta-fold hydrolase